MSDTEEVTFNAPTAKPKKKRVAKAKTAATQAKRAAPFPGLTHTDCANACNAKGCAISGASYCAHPTKGGLQAEDKSDPAALARIQAAREQLDVRLDPDRFK